MNDRNTACFRTLAEALAWATPRNLRVTRIPAAEQFHGFKWQVITK
jgi:hypothetical protein